MLDESTTPRTAHYRRLAAYQNRRRKRASFGCSSVGSLLASLVVHVRRNHLFIQVNCKEPFVFACAGTKSFNRSYGYYAEWTKNRVVFRKCVASLVITDKWGNCVLFITIGTFFIAREWSLLKSAAESLWKFIVNNTKPGTALACRTHTKGTRNCFGCI